MDFGIWGRGIKTWVFPTFKAFVLLGFGFILTIWERDDYNELKKRIAPIYWENILWLWQYPVTLLIYVNYNIREWYNWYVINLKLILIKGFVCYNFSKLIILRDNVTVTPKILSAFWATMWRRHIPHLHTSHSTCMHTQAKSKALPKGKA